MTVVAEAVGSVQRTGNALREPVNWYAKPSVLQKNVALMAVAECVAPVLSERNAVRNFNVKRWVVNRSVVKKNAGQMVAVGCVGSARATISAKVDTAKRRLPGAPQKCSQAAMAVHARNVFVPTSPRVVKCNGPTIA